MRTARDTLLVAFVAVLALVGVAGQAAAHTALISSDPSDGDRLDTAPSTVTLTFNEPLQDADVNQVAVTGPNEEQWAKGDVRVERNVVTAPLRQLGPPGEYVIGFRVLSADGHPVSEEIRFTLTDKGATVDSATASGAPESSTAQDAGGPAQRDTTATAQRAQSAEDSGVPVWVWIVGAVVLLAIGLTVALRMGKTPGR